MEDDVHEVREVKLKRSDSIGLGFSVFGGKGSGLPPVVYQVVDQSPAHISGVLEAGDVILEVNDKDVVSLTTKEVLKCLRLSNDVVTLKVKKDASVRERVHHHMAASSELQALRRSFIAPKEQHNGNNHKTGSNVSCKANGDISHNRENVPPKQPKFESFTMTGELIIKTKSSNFVNFKEQPFNKGEEFLPKKQPIKRESPDSTGGSPVAEKKSSLGYGGHFVRTSRSEDLLQKPPSEGGNSEEEGAASLHNLLLDTSPSSPPECKTSWSCSEPVSSTQEMHTGPVESSHRDTRTGQFIHVPSLVGNGGGDLVSETRLQDQVCDTRQASERHTSSVLRNGVANGVTNIMVDENKICVKVPSENSRPDTLRNTADDVLRCRSPDDESDVESLSSFHYSPKAVDMPSASRLAKRLFNLEGFKKSDVSRHLCKNNDFSRVVGEEYLGHFEFGGESLDSSLRQFLRRFCLIGETQEREGVLLHFSRRYLLCNQGAFKSQDAVHTLTCALMLLNTDLHGENVGRRMSCAEFVENLSGLNEGENFNKEVLKALYHSIKNNPLEWAVDDEEETPTTDDRPSNQPEPRQSFVGHNPFLEVPNPNCATEYKRGYVMRKCCIDPNGKKTPMGKRGWKMFYADLRDLVLYLHKDENSVKHSHQLYDSLHNAIRVHHALATRATDYAKKQHVFRLQTADQAEYLFQTSDSKELQSWIDTINYVAASLSAPSLEGGVGAQKKFQRPLLPAAPTKHNFREQLLEIESKVMKLEKEVEDHHAHPPEKGAKSRVVNDYAEKEQILQHELKRYRTYVFLLRSKVSQFPELETSLTETPIGEVDEERDPLSPTTGGRSLTDRFSYRAAIYRTGDST